VTIAYVGIGSNLDDPQAQVTRAFDELAGLPRTRLKARSSLYRSAPVGHAEQPDFINAVAALDTELSPDTLLRGLQQIENRHGRKRSFANAPRTLDLDLLLFGSARIDTGELQIPHPRMHQRAFVLQPLLEIAPDLPFDLERCRGQRVERIA
jgi:2-amino-4-hydroxy-6-hydroxymethyldihydropteridine diphosphokinase